MSKQDRQGARTPADLERKYYFEKSFAEVMGVALDAQKSVEETRAKIDAELSLKLGYDDAGKIISMINASADQILIEGERLAIKSPFFTLDYDGYIQASEGMIGGCYLRGGVLELENANANYIKAHSVDIEGKITSTEGRLGNVNITTEGLTCGDTSLNTYGLTSETTQDGIKQITRIYAGDLRFYADDKYVFVSPPRYTVSNGFIKANVNGVIYELYFDTATKTVKFL